MIVLVRHILDGCGTLVHVHVPLKSEFFLVPVYNNIINVSNTIASIVWLLQFSTDNVIDSDSIMRQK